MSKVETNAERSSSSDVLVKISGDLISKEEVYDWLAQFAQPSTRLFILCGGGSSITKRLEEKNIAYRFGPSGREIESEKGRSLAEQVLQEQKSLVVEKLHQRRISATVLIPVMLLGEKVCHLNGDEYVKTAYPNFDKIFVLTLTDREKYFPTELERIEVVKF